jgi:hypothetical protein
VLLLSIDDLLSRQPLPVYSACYKERVQTDKDRLKLMAAKDFVTTEIEPLFDAAECLRMGKDLFVQHGMTANLNGIELNRHWTLP